MTTPADTTEPEVASFTGQLLLQEDAEGLAVTLRVTESRVTLFSGRSELGAWPASGVSITPIDDGRYEFVAEGDLLTFTPSDPGAFGASSLIAALAPLPPPKRWRFRKSTEDAPDPAPKPMFAADPPKPKTKRRRKAPEPAADEATTRAPAAEKGPRWNERRRRARSKPAVTDSPRHVSPAPSQPKEPIAPSVDQPAEDLRPASAGRILTRRQQAWLATIDQARQYDLFGLDRVPVTRKMRQGHEHKHTWDHRVSAGFASRHLCTICGKVRLSTRG